ncbi:hypothetical protein [Nesterenkonia flava]|uniref:Integral membrane protein n=1 Tax=Nesterenkonia flava TaxID=469799 RepID=A0ABU1FSB2_9MICC|nr:hypothetical protein [Nesterenkonia flava]MDR5711048.1 hypothetical protein [Nesterenkonia flava]
MSDSAPLPQRPASVWALYVILFLQGAAVVGFTVAETLMSQAEVLDAAGQIAMMVLFVLAGVILILLGFRIFMGSAAARTPSMVLQLLIVVLSFPFLIGGAWLLGLIFLVPAAAALVLLFVRPTQMWLEKTAEP